MQDLDPAGEGAAHESPEATAAPADAPTPAPTSTKRRRPARPWVRLARLPRGKLTAAVIAALIVGVSAGSLTLQPAGTAVGSPGPSTRPGSSTAPEATLGPIGTPLAPEADHPVASLTVDGAAGPVVPLDARFRLHTADGSPAAALAARIHVSPAVELSTTTTADGTVLLAPATPLLPGVVYRFELAGPAGELVDSWAFQARQPLRIIETLPSDQSTDVPLETGIEVTFDQDGVGEVPSHVTIQPATPGRFETHGRTVAFVPDRPLTAQAIYTVTISKGIAVTATGEATEVDTRFAFETAAKESAAQIGAPQFQNDVVESRTADRPVLGMWSTWEENKAPKTLAIEVFRLRDLDAAVDAFRSIRTQPRWARWSSSGLVATTNLTRVLGADVRLNANLGAYWFSLPETLPVGWYLVQTGSPQRAQVVLQVTNVAAYLAVSETRTLVWANDLRTKAPIVGAAVAGQGTDIGTTNGDGLADGPTPAGLLPKTGTRCDQPCDPVVTVRTADGRQVFLPVSSTHDRLEWTGEFYAWSGADPSFWSVLHTDRSRYRTTDTINVWGMARSRGDGAVPGNVTVRLTVASDYGPAGAPVATRTAPTGPTGAFVASIPLVGMPEGTYAVQMLVADTIIRTLYLTVGSIAKPAYHLDVTTGRRVYVAGDRIKVTVNAGFFEGTPVPGVRLRIGGEVERTVTTAVDGSAVTALTATPDEDQEDPAYRTVDVSPARPEEGEIAAASREYYVFPSTRILDGTARVVSGDIDVRGSVHVLARDRVERAVGAGQGIWELDARGAAVGGATVTARFIEIVPVRRTEGTRYDFIEKRVVPIVYVDLTDRDAGTVRARTAADGSFHVVLPDAVKGHDYRVVLSVGDPDGHVARRSLNASSDIVPAREGEGATLRLTAAADPHPYAIGESIDLTMADPDATARDGSRYLFFTAQQGIRSAVVQTSRRFRTPFATWAPPGFDIAAVRWTGTGFVGAVGYSAQFRSEDRRLGIQLTPDAPRYAPGQRATIAVRTTDADGRPTPATVVLRAVDEKLFSIGAAEADDPLNDLYVPLSPGIVGTYTSHHAPRQGFEGGDTTGGGDERDDFRDSLLFEAITTGADGRGKVSFGLSDDLTSWRVSASAVSTDLEAGSNSVLVPVGLPFFVDATIAPEYLTADRPNLAIRTFGSALAAGASVTVEVSAPGLGFASGSLRGTAFGAISVPLPALKPGVQTVTIAATTGTGADRRTDTLTRTFRVVDTRLTRAVQSLTELSEGGASTFGAGTLKGGTGLTSIVVSDATAGRFLPALQELSQTDGARFERAFSAAMANGILADRFKIDAEALDATTFAVERYQGGDGISILPFASADLELSAFVAIVGPDRVNRGRLASYLRSIAADADETRERKALAVAGLAGLGEPVLPEIQRLAADPALTVRERLYVGIGAAAAGDLRTARSIAAALIAAGGEQVGTVARLRAGSSAADTTTATALMAVLAAMIGDHRAPSFWAYVAANPDPDQLQSLRELAYVSASLERVGHEPASFAWTVDGKREVVDLADGGGFHLSLTSSQAATLSIERVSGSIDVLAGWRDATSPSAFQPDPQVTIERSVRPSASVDGSDLVIVDLRVTFGRQAAKGCHDVVELVPSGLMPVGPSAAWVDPNTEHSAYVDATGPYDQSASTVRFCAGPEVSSPQHTLRYFARVITPGTYVWEPAIAQSVSQDGQAALTPASTITIR